ncbi:MAG: hypothetical protein HRT71_11190 [Flavobacteriales bacterium]|nr:hypothetical protein [Flavobacteriales bacterium]
MSVILSLEVANNADINCNAAQEMFMDEIINEGFNENGFHLSKFLNELEIELLHPDFDESKVQKRNPVLMRGIFMKLHEYLKEHDEIQPVYQQGEKSLIEFVDEPLEELIEFCESAIDNQQKVTWSFGV